MNSFKTSAQQQRFIQQLKEVSGKTDPASAAIKINNKNGSYEELLKVPDSALLKIEVYSKKLATKMFGKEEGKNGILLVYLRRGDLFQADPKRGNSHYIYYDNGDSVYCNLVTPATIGGDTTHANWNKFLEKNLHASVPVENECPPGIYNVDFGFLVTKTGLVNNIKVFQDPGYGCAAEVKRLMLQSPVWAPGTCEQSPVNYHQRQRITFLASEQ